jgi:hypothetical protein
MKFRGEKLELKNSLFLAQFSKILNMSTSFQLYVYLIMHIKTFRMQEKIEIEGGMNGANQ